MTAAHRGTEHLVRRGKRETCHLRRRIPCELVGSYAGGREELVRSLRTSDHALVKTRMYAALAELEADFSCRRVKLSRGQDQSPRQLLRTLSRALLNRLAASWTSSVLHGDELRRSSSLPDDGFDVLEAELTSNRAELGKLLARDSVTLLVPAFRHAAGSAQLPGVAQRPG